MTNIEEKREKRLAWKTAYLAASPEEKERMIAQKKEEMRIAEEKRQQKILEDRKARFEAKCDKQIATLKTLLKAAKIAVEITKKFEGKVLNNRLTNLVDAEVKKIGRLYATLKYDAYARCGRLTIKDANATDCWTDDFELKIDYNIDGRVFFTETFEDPSSHLERLISDWKNAKRTYEKVLKKAEKIRREIHEYRKESAYVREFLRTENVIGFTNDL